MRIIKPGKPKVKEILFKCHKCQCEFAADIISEVIEKNTKDYDMYNEPYTRTVWTCNCPNCEKECESLQVPENEIY